jgi:hypothetical protein
MRGMIVLLAAGCSSSTAEVGGGLEIRTSGLAYEVGAPIDIRIVNNTGDMVYVAHCNFRVSLLIEQRSAGAWQPYLQVNATACQDMGPLGERGIEAGATVMDTFKIEQAGEFRGKLYGRRVSDDFGSIVSVSHPFMVRYPPD